MVKREKKGEKLKLVHRWDLVFWSVCLGGLNLLIVSPFYTFFLPLGMMTAIKIGIFLGLAVGVDYFILRFLYSHFLFFSVQRYKRNLANYMLSRNLVTKKKKTRQQGSKEKIKLDTVYLRSPNSYEIVVYFLLNAAKNLTVYDTIPKDLEVEFFGDFKEESDILENKWHSLKSYKKYTFAIENKRNRIPLSEVLFDEKKGLKLMNGVYWNPDEQPHLLIAGGKVVEKPSFYFAFCWGYCR